MFLFLLSVPFFISASVPSAPLVNPPQTYDIRIDNPAKKAGDSLPALLKTILKNIIMPVASVIVVVWIIWAGFSFVLAQGNPKEIKIAKQRLLWALIGAGILLGAAGIAQVVENTVTALTT